MPGLIVALEALHARGLGGTSCFVGFQRESGERMLQECEQRFARGSVQVLLFPRQDAPSRAESARAAGRRSRRRRSHRPSSTATRRASPRSGVTSAAI